MRWMLGCSRGASSVWTLDAAAALMTVVPSSTVQRWERINDICITGVLAHHGLEEPLKGLEGVVRRRLGKPESS